DRRAASAHTTRRHINAVAGRATERISVDCHATARSAERYSNAVSATRNGESTNDDAAEVPHRDAVAARVTNLRSSSGCAQCRIHDAINSDRRLQRHTIAEELLVVGLKSEARVLAGVGAATGENVDDVAGRRRNCLRSRQSVEGIWRASLAAGSGSVVHI